MADEAYYAAMERRIETLLGALGAVGAVTATLGWGLRAGIGFAAGAALCWLNFRWLRQGAMALTQLGLAQADASAVKVPRRVHAKFFGRLVLLLAAVYAILAWLRLPVVPALCGLVVVLPAVVLELLYELAHGFDRSGVL